MESPGITMSSVVIVIVILAVIWNTILLVDFISRMGSRWSIDEAIDRIKRLEENHHDARMDASSHDRDIISQIKDIEERLVFTEDYLDDVSRRSKFYLKGKDPKD